MSAIEQQMADNISLHGEFFLVDAINIMIQGGAQLRVQPVDIWLDAGKPEALLETNRYLLEHGRDNNAAANKRAGVTIIPPVFIHPEAEVEVCVIGPHVSIDKGARIQNSIIKDSIVEQGAVISHKVLESSLIGRQATVNGRAEKLNIGDDSWIEI